MRPPEVLDQQAALIDYLDSRYYHAYMTNFSADMVRKSKLESSMTGQQMCQTLQTSLKVAQAFHVQAEMLPLLRSAAMDLDEDDHLVHSRLPAENGFLVLDEPYTITDVWGSTLGFSAIAWRHGGAHMAGSPGTRPGVWITYFTDLHDTNDTITQDIIRDQGIETVRRLGRFQVNHMTWLGYHQPVGPTELISPEEYAQYATGENQLAGKAPNPIRMVVGLFRLLNQVIVEVADADVDRKTARRMTQKNLPARVQTIKLRRKIRVGNEERVGTGHVDWQHSWAVRGHWAWRKCNADHPSAEEYEKGYHTRVYVAPYLKGPDDKPLKTSEKVWGLAQ